MELKTALRYTRREKGFGRASFVSNTGMLSSISKEVNNLQIRGFGVCAYEKLIINGLESFSAIKETPVGY